MKALESVASGDDPEAEGVMKLVEPYRLDGPNPRPEVLSCIFNVMSAMGGSSRSRVRAEHQQRAENTCPNHDVPERPRDVEHARHGEGSRYLAKTAAETAAP
mgnify:FL=1